MKSELKSPLAFLILTLVFIRCGSIEVPVIETSQDQHQESASGGISAEVENPFESGPPNGDRFLWGYFIRGPYQSKTVTELPIPIYLAYFDEQEIEIIEEGVAIANEAIGYEHFVITDLWSAQVRVIYKVSEINFPEVDLGLRDESEIIGYTYSRNIYLSELYDAGRIVTDWAMELKAGVFNEWVVAHELGHAMGIQEHALIDYENDTTVELEPHSLMSAIIEPQPALNDYYFMMQEQAEILREYM